jgi:preprotein translocase subunit SecA
MAQRDPLVEYQREGYELFVAMMEGIKEESAGYLFNVEVTVEQEAPPAGEAAPGGATSGAPALPTDERPVTPAAPPKLVAKGLGGDRPRTLEYSAPSVDAAGEVTHRVESESGQDVVVDPNASRAERRRQQREARRRG